jgi:hypothetical protein
MTVPDERLHSLRLGLIRFFMPDPGTSFDYGPANAHAHKQAEGVLEILRPFLDRHEQMVRRQSIQDLHAGRVTVEEVAAAGCETRHVIDLRDDGWTVKHPLTCRADLFACPVNVAAGRDLTEPPDDLGQYACGLDVDGRFTIADKITAGES